MRVLAATAIGSLLIAGAAFAQTSTNESKQQAYTQQLDAQAKAHDAAQAKDDAAFKTHEAKVHAMAEAARKSGNKAQLAEAQKEEAADEAHIQREHTDNVANQAHDTRLEQRNKTKTTDTTPH